MKRIIKPLIAFSAGALLGGAMIHMIPQSIAKSNNNTGVFIWLLIGYSLFFLLEQFLNWHRARHDNHHQMDISPKNPNPNTKSSSSYLILIADGLHNFIGGFAIASSFLIDINIGIITVVSAAAHEIPQEFGDFGILVHGGWKRQKALVLNFISALLIIPGGLLTYFLAINLGVGYLLAFAAGNFVYISTSDLIPEITHGQVHEKKQNDYSLKQSLSCFSIFILGLAVIFIPKFIFG